MWWFGNIAAVAMSKTGQKSRKVLQKMQMVDNVTINISTWLAITLHYKKPQHQKYYHTVKSGLDSALSANYAPSHTCSSKTYREKPRKKNPRTASKIQLLF